MYGTLIHKLQNNSKNWPWRFRSLYNCMLYRLFKKKTQWIKHIIVPNYCTCRSILSPLPLSRDWWCKVGFPVRSPSTSGPSRCLTGPKESPLGCMRTSRGPSRWVRRSVTLAWILKNEKYTPFYSLFDTFIYFCFYTQMPESISKENYIKYKKFLYFLISRFEITNL